MKLDEELLKKTTTNMDTSLFNLGVLLSLGDAIAAVAKHERYATTMRAPIIAGGAIRDTLFGLRPNDWDVFFDVSHIEDSDAREDFTLMYLADLLEEARKDEGMRQDLAFASIEALNGNYAPHEEVTHFGDREFIVYQTSWQWANDMPEVPMIIQAIGRKDTRLSKADPVDFLDDFDYAAVKALYDPTGLGFVFHPEFEEFLDKRVLETDDTNTLRRIQSWSGRFYPKVPFEIKNNGPKVDLIGDVGTGTINKLPPMEFANLRAPGGVPIRQVRMLQPEANEAIIQADRWRGLPVEPDIWQNEQMDPQPLDDNF